MKKSYNFKKIFRAIIAIAISVFMFYDIVAPTLVYAANSGIIKNIEVTEDNNSNGSLESNNSNSQTKKIEKCSGEKCSHVYRDLNDELQPICEKGVEMINSGKYNVKRTATRAAANSFAGQGIYLVKLDDVTENLSNVELGKNKIEYVEANFLLEGDENESSKKTFRMYRIGIEEEPVYATVVPDDVGNTRYNRVYFTIYFKQEAGSTVKVDETFITNFTEENKNGKLKEITGTLEGTDFKKDYHSNILLTPRTRNCLYVGGTIGKTYWSGAPSEETHSLRNQVLYVDNRLNPSSNVPFWDNGEQDKALWINYRVKQADGTYKVITDRISTYTSTERIRYYKFPANTKATERSLIIVSNKPPVNEIFPNETKTYMFLYNIASGDNCLVIRNIEAHSEKEVDTSCELDRNFITYNAEGSREILFRDRMGEYVKTGNTVQYRVSKTENGFNLKWETMTKVTDGNSIDKNTLWTTGDNKYKKEESKYIQFRIRRNGKTVYETGTLEVNQDYAAPTFFLDVFQKPKISGFYGTGKTEDDEKDGVEYNKKLTGCWVRRIDNNNHGDSYIKNGEKVGRIPSGVNKEETNNQYMAKATFYDYYSDAELKGKPSEEVHNSQIPNIPYTRQAGTFNYAVDAYYGSKGKIQAGDKWNKLNAMYGATSSPRIDSDKDNKINCTGHDRYPKADNDPRKDNWNNTPTNTWWANLNHSTGIVDDTLDAEGNMTQNGKDYIPQFNEGFLRGDNEVDTNIGAVYPNVDFGFRLNDEGYWEFNSSKDIDSSAKLKQDKEKGYYLERVKDENGNYVPNKYSSENGFFPFDDQPNSNNKNHLFGMKMNIPFRITESGTIKKQNQNEKPVIFRFTGDDDIWIYIDDKLALDIGGIHDAITGEINFQDGTVNLKLPNGTEKSVQPNIYADVLRETLKQKYGLKESDSNEKFIETGRKYLSESEHKLNIFYMERGLAKSNLQITFNFPTKNLLTVSNEIDTSAANRFFKSALDTLGGINYFIKNQVTKGKPLAVENSAGFIGAGRNEVFNAINSIDNISTQNGGVGVKFLLEGPRKEKTNILQVTPSKDMDDWADKETMKKYLVSIGKPDGSTMDVSNFAYLKFDIYNGFETSPTGTELYVQLTDEKGNSVGDWASNLTYKSYSNVLPQGEWASERISLDTLKKLAGSNVDFTKIKSIDIGYNRSKTTSGTMPAMYLDEFRFFEQMRVNEEISFSVQDNDISDYGSLAGYREGFDYNNAKMSFVDKAWYMLYTKVSGSTLYNEGTPFSVENGMFGLADGQKAEFVNKFRLGTYIQLEQENLNKKIFDTTWSLKEEGKEINANSLVPTKLIETVKNDAISDLQDVDGYYVDDGRTVIKNGNEIPAKPDKKPQSEQVAGEDVNKGTFIFRRFDNPDDKGKQGVNLNVEYKNVLKVGGIYLEKKINEKAKFNQRFRFHIHYRNVAGRYLEENIDTNSTDSKTDLVQTVDIVILAGKKTASILIEGIPAGTEYTIHEINNTPIKLDVGACYQYVKGADGNAIEPSQTNIDAGKVAEETDINKKHENVRNDEKAEYTSDEGGKEPIKLTYDAIKGTTYNSIQKASFTNEGYKDPNGAIRITKELQGTTYTEDKDFLFHVHYDKKTNKSPTPGITSTEIEHVTVPVTVTVPAGETWGSTSVQNIPVELDEKGNKIPTEYWVHEVDDSNLVDIREGKSYIIGTMKEHMENSGNWIDKDNNSDLLGEIHTDIKIFKNANLDEEVKKCGKNTVVNYAQGKARTSQKEYIFTNSGPVSVAIKKKNQEGKPLTDAGFSIYKKENGKDIFLKEVRTTYYEKLPVVINPDLNPDSPVYDKENNRYKIGGKSYIVYKENNELYYYKLLAKDEIVDYEEDGILGKEADNRVVETLAVFDNLVKGDYKLDETTIPSGYRKTDMTQYENITLPTKDGINEINDVMYEVINIDRYELPETGRGRIIKWTMAGMLMVAVGAGFILLKKNKEREGDN